MLGFFRRHQKYFFIVITVVIVISFSFFGTYSTLSNSSFREQIAFRTINGTDITRHQLDEMVAFIGTDSTDKLMFGGIWGPNFLNDGVIAKDFMQTGLGVILATQYANDMNPDLIARLDKEKRFSLYVHPQARFIGVESAWNYFAPAMTSYYNQIRSASNPFDPSALQARAALFLMEKQFPQQLLRQVLRYQEKQNNWITPDRNLDRTDLSLFGYHTAEDWFGPRFMRLAAQFIMNAAIIAEQKGYEVSKADALADLARNAEMSYQQNARSPHLGVATSQEYYNEQMRRLGMDQNSAAGVWRQVMLFRRLFQDMGSSVLIDPHTFKEFNTYALESVNGEIYRLPKELRINNLQSMQKLEAYIDAVSKRLDTDKAKLTLPTTFLSAALVKIKYPELVRKRYLLEIAQVNKKSLEGNVGLKESWNWEASDKGWELLTKQFPELGIKKGKTQEERFVAIESLDGKTRDRIDAYARNAIVEAHPEWIDQALDNATPTKVSVSLHDKGGNYTFSGLTDGKDLMKQLDANDKIAQYTADKTVYYRIAVIDRAAQPEILTFAEADREGVLSKLIDKQLETYYTTIRESDPEEFQKEDKSWKAFTDVKSTIAEKYYSKLLNSIKSNYAAAISSEVPPEMIADYAATLRLYPYVKDLKEKLQKDQSLAATLTREPTSEKEDTDTLSAQPPLADQWKLERTPYQNTRSSGEALLDNSQVFTLEAGDWTKVNTPANGDLNFFHVASKGNNVSNKTVNDAIAQARGILSADAQQHLMYHILTKIQEKGAMSLEYMNQTAEREPTEEVEG